MTTYTTHHTGNCGLAPEMVALTPAEAEMLRGLRDGSLVAIPRPDDWQSSRIRGTDVPTVILAYPEGDYMARERALAALDLLAAAPEPPR